MTDEDALHQECPRKILGLLHVKGVYIHCTSNRFPGKVLCFHKDSERPEDCVPTPAQAHLWQSEGAPHGATG